MNWQPIETAPKDGTWVSVFCRGSGIIYTDVYWCCFGNRWLMTYEDCILYDTPTHWLKLEPPPEE